MPEPEWKPVVGYEGLYSVSDHGQVRSEARVTMRRNGRPITVRERILRPGINRHGYPAVVLRDGRTSKTFKVHVLMLAAFVGPCPPGQEGLHADDVRTHNVLTNLRYGTRSQNIRDCVRNGHHHWANKTECPKGHRYAEHAYHYRGRRLCAACRADYQRAHRAAKKRTTGKRAA